MQKLPPDPEGMNDDRASWAQEATKAFQKATDVDECILVADLISDLMHLMDRRPSLGHFETELAKGRSMYGEETKPDSVKDAFNMICPKCLRDDCLDVEVKTSVKLTPVGLELYSDETVNGEWDDNSLATCNHEDCEWFGPVRFCRLAAEGRHDEIER